MTCRGAPQENDAKFRFAIHQQGIWQLHDNSKIAKSQKVPDCCHIGASQLQNAQNCTIF